MKRRQVTLDRLFKTARQAPAQPIEPMPAYLPTRVLARLRTETLGEDVLLVWGRVLKVGLGLAVAIMLTCVAWNYRDLSLEPENFVELATVRAHVASGL